MDNLWTKAHIFLMELKVGEGYSSGGVDVSVTKRTETKIHLSNKVIVSFKKYGNFIYLDSKSIIRNNKPSPLVNQILRDIEGYLIYKKLTSN